MEENFQVPSEKKYIMKGKKKKKLREFLSREKQIKTWMEITSSLYIGLFYWLIFYLCHMKNITTAF